MGSGCSSPLRRFGGKRSKTRRESSPEEAANGDSDNQDANVNNACRTQQPQSVSTANARRRLNLDNEITVQSEINEDHPSSASYYTDGRVHNDETTKISEHSASLDPKASGSTGASGTSGGAARVIGLNGSYVPHDRHLLVSPALSPAPSTCYSPSPASSTFGCATPIDLNDLNEAFKTLTFGLPNQVPTTTASTTTAVTKLNKQRIQQPERQQSELHHYYTQQLFQTQDDLINYITMIFIATDNFHFTFTTPDGKSLLPQGNVNSNIETLANLIESNSKKFCDEHLFNLRFLNLSYTHLSDHFHINNLLDASMRILEHEYHKNSQRMIVVVLSSNTSANSIELNPNHDKQNQPLDKRQLPIRIEAQSMNKLQNVKTANLDVSVKDYLKRWYNQVGDTFYLNPIYLVYPKILSESKEERDEAWQSWLKESNLLIKLFEAASEEESPTPGDLKLRSIYSSFIEFITKEPALQKRTLLIRNYSQLSNSGSSNQQQQITHTQTSKDGSINELAKLLADPNKMMLKRSTPETDFYQQVGGWIHEHFIKYVESILESRILHGKHVPPFIDPNLFIELTSQRHHLEYYLDNVTESFESKSNHFYGTQVLPILNKVVSSSANGNNESALSTVEQQGSQPAASHLVFISGSKGSGKSTLFAQLVKYAVQDMSDKVQIIYRFCGVTLDSLSPSRLLRSICEQFCQTRGENITAASHIYSSRREIINALNKTINQQTSLIFLDNLDALKLSSEQDLNWLVEVKANPRLKIIVMIEAGSDLYKKAMVAYSDAQFIGHDDPTISEWAQMLTHTVRTRRFNSASSLYDEVKKLGSATESETKFTYKDVYEIVNMCRLRQLNNESIYPELTAKVIQSQPIESLKNVQKIAISHLQYILTPYQLCALFVAFESSRNGLSESDIINIMRRISKFPKSSETCGMRFSATLLNYLIIQLRPWLRYIVHDKTIKIVVQEDFTARALEQYIPSMFPNIETEIREILLEYFGRATNDSRLLPSKPSKGSETLLAEPKDHVSLAERFWLATQASEVINLLLLTDPVKARDHILNKQQFFLQFLYGSMPEEFIEDYHRLKDAKKVGNSEELQNLVNYIKQSIYPLRYDGSQIYSQIYCRAYESIKTGKFVKNKKMNDILSVASCPPIPNLLPVSEASINSFIKTRIGKGELTDPAPSTTSAGSLTAQQLSASRLGKPGKAGLYSQQPGAGGPAQTKQRIYTIKDNHRHVIVIYPDKGCLAVWDIYEEKAVRTIYNLDQPRDLKMIDQRRAVVLCNRELRVYDLDSGVMLTELKGVMNQKMPFFEVFGEKYVVALARNRMYVNMLNLSTGELETTFKVGEDRFLNSLLVSANGGICVCGDETQKPFPLLVWNLNERRLLYDLRLDRHEFITRMSAISDDGHFVVSVCKQIGDANGPTYGANTSNSSSATGPTKSSPNFIVIYDLNSGTLFKKWKPGLDSCSVAISLSANRSGRVINTIVDSSILIWDIATGSKRHTLIGHSAPADVIQVQNNRLFSMDSTCRDQSLRIWDIELGYCLAVFSPDAPVNCCQMSIRGDALVCGFAAETRLSTLLMCKNETVSDVVKRNKRRKSSKSIYVFDEPPSRKSSS